MANPTGSQGNDIAGYESFSGSKQEPYNFLWWCAGAHAGSLKSYPTEYAKYNTLGGVLLATLALAALSSGYAFYTIFGRVDWAIAFAILWGLIIFNFDRFMVSTIRKYGVSTMKQWRVAIPRVVLAVLIGITIARPLELKLFEKEIRVQVEKNLVAKARIYNNTQDSIYADRVARIKMERDQLLSRKKSMEDTLLRLQQSYVMEADGTGGSGRRGVEKITRLKQDAYNQTASQYAGGFKNIDSTLVAHNLFLSTAETELLKDKENFVKTTRDNVGFLERNKALTDLSKNEESVWLANFLISLLIIILEVAPILAKLLLPVGPYDLTIAKSELVPMTALEKAIQLEQEKLRSSSMSAV